MRKQTKIAALVSAAALLAIGASMTASAATGWVETYAGSGDWQWFDSYGDPVYDEWKTYNGEWFYLGEDSFMLKDQIFTDSEDHTFCVDSLGRRVKGWVSCSNDEGLDLNGDGSEDSVLWMYFNPSNGRAIKADSGDIKTGSLEWSGGKHLFVFNDSGYMLSGWYDDDQGTIYYLGTEDEGWARTGWCEIEENLPPGHVCPDDDHIHWYYFNPVNSKAYTAKDGYKYIDGRWYSFDENGILNTSWQPYTGATPGDSTTPPASTNYVYNDVNGSIGYGWVYTKEQVDCGNDDSHWYYLVTYRNVDADKNNFVARSIAFNAGTGKIAAKSINGKTYLFDGSDGKMLTGLQVLTADTATAAALGANYPATGVKVLKKGTYYFNEPDDPKASNAGQMMTGKQTIVDDDGVDSSYYYFAKKTTTYTANGASDTAYTIEQGMAYENAIVDGVLYGSDGKRIQAEDGNTYILYTITSSNPIRYLKGTKVIDITNSTIVVNNVGRVKTSGSVKIDDVTYEIKDSNTLNATVK